MPRRRDSSRVGAFGRAVREVRARRGMSQMGLGRAAGLHHNYVGAIERGEINPTLGTIDKLAVGLNMPLSELAAIYERNIAEDAGERRS
ncbi:helix-turn-helix transcriptional regulator [Conexibacter stalactiti]|uniref:Helix-turn-helix transcriptional regulator n=1 Tax=Conexibacter stalactiti TaxID=1940611 RepID=A0ABU4HJG8_9ACTN|nr:helix-turn-helix transcriptional regulator [Conexibacter stalactiti]MDW5593412.1 helix-turn-helix transcriptional regulator [Conexibacter stalactiti]MEC5034053.1 helix-turn-helix transcriptional regulator [Conexibacter stalactiti]